MKARVLALYLPQFHPIKENNEWWGPGFTEWTNVGKARRMYPGHYQPRVPADLGYYDLRVAETRQAQADMALNYGVEGFLYWHYWFGKGRRLMERPINEVLACGKPDFPFALAWANASWFGFEYGENGRNLLIEQTYPGKEDFEEHFYKVLTALKDKRYITVDGKPFFMIFQPFQLPDQKEFIDLWQNLAIKNGLKGIHFVAQTNQTDKVEELRAMGFDAVNLVRMYDSFIKGGNWFQKYPLKALGRAMNRSFNVRNYAKAMKYWVGAEERQEYCYPTLISGWDHTPRSGKRGVILSNTTPCLFEKHCDEVFSEVENKEPQHRVVVLKSWNEWAEGNYMEPDQRWGHGFLKALKNAQTK